MIKKKEVIFLLGMPGSGKGTQGAILSKKLLLPHISVGDILRGIASGTSEDAEVLNKFMNQGKLAPVYLVNKVVRDFVLSSKCPDRFIIDGYPRNVEQAKYFINNIDVSVKVVFFDISEDIAIKRVLGRFSCLCCKKLYNKYFDNTIKEGVCDICGSTNFIARGDDNSDVILLRIEEYKNETVPAIDYCKKKVEFFTVNAEQTKDLVQKELFLITKNI